MSHGASTLHHQFETPEQQKESATLGMWLFLVNEVMFFGGLFTAYALYRWRNPDAFLTGSALLDIRLGLINTVILIGSSLTMALAVHAAQTSKKRSLVGWLSATGILGLAFLVIKGFEYAAKWEHNLVPGLHGAAFTATAGHGAGFHLVGSQVQMFFALYFAMTGMHAMHMIVGVGILAWLLVEAQKGRFDAAYHNPIENFGLYWHFVDIIWIFLFPLLYLLGLHHRG